MLLFWPTYIPAFFFLSSRPKHLGILCLLRDNILFLIRQLVQLPLIPTRMFAICSQELHSPPSPLHCPLLALRLPALLLKGGQPVNPCSSSSHNSGFHIWPCSWLKSLNKEAISYFWSHSLLFMNLCPVIFLLRGREGTAQSWRYGYTMACALRTLSTY